MKIKNEIKIKYSKQKIGFSIDKHNICAKFHEKYFFLINYPNWALSVKRMNENTIPDAVASIKAWAI